MPYKVVYQLNINDPDVAKAHREFKLKRKIPINFPLTDDQRIAFELTYLYEKLKASNGQKNDC